MSGEAVDLYLHLGAHKTATTYLQDLLEANAARIAEAGRVYWRRDLVRPKIDYGIPATRKGRYWLYRAAEHLPFLSSDPIRGFSRLLRASRPSVISEENILGNVPESLHGKLYPRAAERLQPVVRALDGRSAEIYLCVRDYAPYLSSLYAESLRQGALLDPAQFAAANSDPAGQWSGLAETILAAFPNARLVVWAFEDFRKLEAAIVQRFSGMERSAMQDLPAGTARPSPSQDAVERHLKRAAGMNHPDRLISILELESAFPATAERPKFQAFGEEQSKRMRSAYEADKAEIAAMPRVEWLTP